MRPLHCTHYSHLASNDCNVLYLSLRLPVVQIAEEGGEYGALGYAPHLPQQHIVEVAIIGEGREKIMIQCENSV